MTGVQTCALPILRRETAAELAGVRASGVLLACLPVLGIGLGALVGAQPLDVLFGTGVGRVLLGVGVGLDALGLLWLRRLGERVAR